jgi:DNA-binding transcriptional MerR regulator
MPEPGEDRLLTEEEVAKLCRVSLSAVRYWRRHGTGPEHVWAGRYPRYWRSKVLEWLAREPEADGD